MLLMCHLYIERIVRIVGNSMAYGELEGEALTWTTRSVFGLDPSSMPSKVVITPSEVEGYFVNFQDIMTGKGLTSERLESGFLVRKGDRQFLFCKGGIGASIFASSAYILCHCRNVNELIFVGTGGGIGKDLESADINIPTSCIRLDKVLEVLLPPGPPAWADSDMARKLGDLIREEVRDLGIKVHEGMHATVPFFCSETKQLLNDLRERGALSVDMELSVLYALANYYGLKSAGIIRIGDLPLKGLPTWISRSYKVELKREVHMKILNAIIKYLLTS